MSSRAAALAARGLGLTVVLAVTAGAQDSPPLDFDAASGRHLRWSAPLGSYSYGGPVVVDGRIFVGTNNAVPRDVQREGDLGVLLALSADTGEMLWQATHGKLHQELDFPLQGVTSTPAVVQDRVYYVSNRGELVCLDAAGFADGENDGPFRDEKSAGPRDADVVWSLDLRAELGVVPHYMSSSTPAVLGDLVFTLTSNGIDERGGVPAPEAPSFVAVDRLTGEVRWTDASPGGGLIDGQWASARVASLPGGPQVLFPAGDGRLYALAPSTGDVLWVHDGNRLDGGEAPERRHLNAFVASAVTAGERIYIPVGRDPEQGSAPGGIWCLEPGATAGAPEVAWFYGGRDFGRAIADVAVSRGVAYAASLDGFVVALDAVTGELLWKHDVLAPVWATPQVFGDQLWIADTDGEIEVLAAGRELKRLAEIRLASPLYRAPVWHEGILYVMTSERLHAIAVE
jgi:outer membrane protein assembly factor BamB